MEHECYANGGRRYVENVRSFRGLECVSPILFSLSLAPTLSANFDFCLALHHAQALCHESSSPWRSSQVLASVSRCAFSLLVCPRIEADVHRSLAHYNCRDASELSSQRLARSARSDVHVESSSRFSRFRFGKSCRDSKQPSEDGGTPVW